MNPQIQSKLLNALRGETWTEDRTKEAEHYLLDSTDDELWNALALLDERENECFKVLRLDRKIRTIIQKREAEEAGKIRQLQRQEIEELRTQRKLENRRYWGPLIVGILGLLVGLISTHLAIWQARRN